MMRCRHSRLASWARWLPAPRLRLAVEELASPSACCGRKGCPSRLRHSGFRELTHPPFPFHAPARFARAGAARLSRGRGPGQTPRGYTCGPVGKKSVAQASLWTLAMANGEIDSPSWDPKIKVSRARRWLTGRPSHHGGMDTRVLVSNEMGELIITVLEAD